MGKRFDKDALAKATVVGSAGLVVAIFTVIASASFAALLFNGPISGYVTTGIRMALTTAVLVGCFVTLTSSCRGVIAIPQDRIVPILAILSGTVVARMPDASPEQQALTVIAAVILVTLITGLFLYGLGQLKLGNLIRYIPYPVIGGFLGGSGWLLATGGIRVMTGHPFTLENLPSLFGREQMLHWLPGAAFGACLFWVLRKAKNRLLIPGLLLFAIGIFYFIVWISGSTIDQVRVQGWLPELPASGGPGLFSVASIVSSFSWGLLLNHVNILATILLTSVVSILLTASALELSVQQEIDLNRELRCAGAATFLSGLTGGIVGFQSLSMSRLALSMGAWSRGVGLISAACCAVVLWVGPGFVFYVPRFVCGGLLFFLGVVFLWEWTYEASRKLTRLDYFVVLLILAIVGAVGYPQGVATGIIAAVVLFVHNYSRVDVVSHAMSGADLRSNVDRPVRELRFLRENGEQIFALRLQGFIFFGTANHLFNEVRVRTADSRRQRLRFVVMDFRRVTGIDSSAVFSLSKVHQLARKLGFTLIMTHVAPEIQKQLVLGGLQAKDFPSFRLFPDLDHGLEWCENLLLSSWTVHPEGEPGTLHAQLQDLWPKDVPSHRLLAYLEPEDVEAGTYLIRQTEHSECLYFIESGRVTARVELENGQHLRLRTMGAGTIVGEVGMFLGGQRMASVITEQSCKVYRLTAGALARMRTEDPALALAFHHFLIRLLAERLTTTSDMLRGLQE
jgi:SulP family sulfate permease